MNGSEPLLLGCIIFLLCWNIKQHFDKVTINYAIYNQVVVDLIMAKILHGKSNNLTAHKQEIIDTFLERNGHLIEGARIK